MLHLLSYHLVDIQNIDMVNSKYQYRYGLQLLSQTSPLSKA